MKKMNKKGFTIVELVIVIAVIAILAAVLIPTFSTVVNKANLSSATQTARSTLTNALNMSSNASLSGQTSNDDYTTMIVINGYAFGYTGNELVSIDYPTSDTTIFYNEETDGKNSYNAILIAAENLVADEDNDKNYTLKEEEEEPTDWDTTYTNYYTKATNNNVTTYTKVASADNAPDWAASKYYSREDIVFEIKNVADVIKAWSDDNTLGCTDIETISNVTLVGGTYYLNYGAVDYKVGDVVYYADTVTTEPIYADADSVSKFDAASGANVWSTSGSGHTKAHIITSEDYGFIGKAAAGDDSAIAAVSNPYAYDATVYINTDFSNKVVVFTTFGK